MIFAELTKKRECKGDKGHFLSSSSYGLVFLIHVFFSHFSFVPAIICGHVWDGGSYVILLKKFQIACYLTFSYLGNDGIRKQYYGGHFL